MKNRSKRALSHLELRIKKKAKITHHSSFCTPNSERGQVIVLLLLVIVVSLSVGLAITTRSLTEVSTSTKNEDSSRAFFAAEAGIEQALSQSATQGTTILSNDSKYDLNVRVIPELNQALQYPQRRKELVSQVWLADPVTLAKYYERNNLDIYFGKPETYTTSTEIQNKPAVAITLIYRKDLGEGRFGYSYKRYLFDSNELRSLANGFTRCVSSADFSDSKVDTHLGDAEAFYCKMNISFISSTDPIRDPAMDMSKDVPILLRVRFIYSSKTETFAIKPIGGCGLPCSLPPQAKILRSEGRSGEIIRKLELFQIDNVVPQIIDYAIFSPGSITK